MRAYDQVRQDINLLNIVFTQHQNSPADRAHNSASALGLIEPNFIKVIEPPENVEDTVGMLRELITVLQGMKGFSVRIDPYLDELIRELGQVLTKEGSKRLAHAKGPVKNAFEALRTALKQFS